MSRSWAADFRHFRTIFPIELIREKLGCIREAGWQEQRTSGRILSRRPYHMLLENRGFTDRHLFIIGRFHELGFARVEHLSNAIIAEDDGPNTAIGAGRGPNGHSLIGARTDRALNLLAFEARVADCSDGCRVSIQSSRIISRCLACPRRFQ